MIIDADIGSDKTDYLLDKYVSLLNSGISSESILVLVQNSSLKENFINKALEKTEIDTLEKINVHSFFSLVYNTVSDNWAFLESSNSYQNPVILPHLAGLEVSQFIMKDILKSVPFKGYNSRMSLMQQLFRRYSLIVQNNLSPKEIKERAQILKEGFSDEAELTLNKFLKRTLQLRDFDYLRQCLLFNFICKNTDYFKNIKYLIVDDADECTPICIDFIIYLSKQLKEVYIIADSKGSSRCGYLSADKNNLVKLKNTFNEDIITCNNFVIYSKLHKTANILYDNVINSKKNILDKFTQFSFPKRIEMITHCIHSVKALLKKKVKPCEIAIITPTTDDMLKFTVRENLSQNINLLSLSGNEKLIQNKLVRSVLIILKLHTVLKQTLTKQDIIFLIVDILHIPIKYCEEILEGFERNNELIEYTFADNDYNGKYNKLLSLIKELSVSKDKISEQILTIYNEIFDFRFIKSETITKFNFFLKEIRDFEDVFKTQFNEHKTDIILQIENSVISENPYSVLNINQNDLIISTPQKIIDNHIKTKYQIWLDITNSDWIKSDIGPLYNAWVFQKDWEKDNYTIEDNISLSKDKTARMLRKLTLCADEEIYCYSSLFDSNGVENFGAIEEYIITDNNDDKVQDNKPVFNIIPRQDQKPVLEYKSGLMGISAVPGAGKTTILLALILKLLDKGINPENIFVLTYMESAARNFRERIKSVNKKSSKLPNISTIHGLALRILKENGNFEKLGLSSDFDICDDVQKTRLMQEIGKTLKIDLKQIEDYIRAVSTFKMYNCNFNNTILNDRLKKFKAFYTKYQENLKISNLIDYDDMLIGSVKILKENSDILEHYQEVCKYLIEDEAQDSSAIQQKLITLLAGKHKNVIRCGDVNQSITMTFSNADVEGFRNFITNNNNISMDCSQRCSKPVWELANKIVEYYSQIPDTKNAFFKMFMHPVEGRNPQASEKGVYPILFKTNIEERNYILKVIKNTLAKNPQATVGILLRSNRQVAFWQNFIENNGLKVITRNTCLEQKSVFKSIFAILNMISEPFNNTVISNNYRILAELGFYKLGLDVEIEKYENPFITINPDYILNTDLQQFWWDLNDWVCMNSLTPEQMVLKIGKQFFKSDIEKSNVYLISTLVKRICINNNSLNYVITRLGELSKRPSLSGFKFFSEEDEEDKKFLQGKVQIMTMHKSKGDEFNLVFIPELSDRNLGLSIESIKLKAFNLVEEVKTLSPNYKKKTDYELKKEILEENLRLFYVAITRAKNDLFITTSLKSGFGKSNNEPCMIFEDVLGVEYV